MPKVNGVRYVTVEDKKIFDYLKEKDKLVKEVQVMQKQIDEIAKDGEKLGAKIQKIKDKAIPIMEKQTDKIELSEWEIVTTFQIENDKVTAQILDQVEASKDRIRDSKLNAKK